MENSDLQLSKITISPSEPLKFVHLIPDFESTLNSFVHKVPIKEIFKNTHSNILFDKFESLLEKDSAKAVYDFVKNSGIIGLSEEEIQVI